MPTITRQEAEALIVRKAQSEPAFRKQLLDDPKGVISRAFGVDLPAGLQISIVEENATTLYLVLPPAPPVSGELADAELEAVAGGLSKGTQQVPTGTDQIVVTTLPQTQYTMG